MIFLERNQLHKGEKVQLFPGAPFDLNFFFDFPSLYILLLPFHVLSFRSRHLNSNFLLHSRFRHRTRRKCVTRCFGHKKLFCDSFFHHRLTFSIEDYKSFFSVPRAKLIMTGERGGKGGRKRKFLM